ncbi:hypothetical protein EVAR_24729_1 [Eumeta japonica]|uniref:Uncharacterized protein n=1 Tax=Eumeta variegata TaxID=151549 RepID=A0A4C1VD51_EUMVA|nr:hypothetical protein EVAR_24729_1 [Eumeta japonica]
MRADTLATSASSGSARAALPLLARAVSLPPAAPFARRRRCAQSAARSRRVSQRCRWLRPVCGDTGVLVTRRRPVTAGSPPRSNY